MDRSETDYDGFRGCYKRRSSALWGPGACEPFDGLRGHYNDRLRPSSLITSGKTTEAKPKTRSVFHQSFGRCDSYAIQKDTGCEVSLMNLSLNRLYDPNGLYLWKPDAAGLSCSLLQSHRHTSQRARRQSLTLASNEFQRFVIIDPKHQVGDYDLLAEPYGPPLP